MRLEKSMECVKMARKGVERVRQDVERVREHGLRVLKRSGSV